MAPRTKLDWIRENASRWDADKRRIVGGQPAGIFDLSAMAPNEPVPGEWWRASHEGVTLGYAWMDRTWDGGEILLAVDPTRQGHGVGTFMLDRLAKEAAARGLNQLYNIVRDTHPERERVTTWLKERGFTGGEDGELKRPVKKRSSP